MLHLRPGNIRPRRQGIADHSDRSGLQCGVDVLIAVGGLAAHGDEAPAGLHPTAVVIQSCDGRIALQREVSDAIQQLEEVHFGHNVAL